MEHGTVSSSLVPVHRDCIRIHKMEITVALGVHDAERERLQRLCISLAAYLDLSPCADVDDSTFLHTVNYSEIAQYIRLYVRTFRPRTLEYFTHTLLRALFVQFPTIADIEIQVRKPGALFDAEAASVTVRRPRAFYLCRSNEALFCLPIAFRTKILRPGIGTSLCSVERKEMDPWNSTITTPSISPYLIGDWIDVVLALGSNLGDTIGHLEWAYQHIYDLATSCAHRDPLLSPLIRISATYKTPPEGLVMQQPQFLNACVVFRMPCCSACGVLFPSQKRDAAQPVDPLTQVRYLRTPVDLLHWCKDLEKLRGRHPEAPRHSARPLDVDILFVGSYCISEPLLSIPHCALHQRLCALRPLCDIEPNRVHPVYPHRTIQSFLDELVHRRSAAPDSPSSAKEDLPAVLEWKRVQYTSGSPRSSLRFEEEPAWIDLSEETLHFVRAWNVSPCVVEIPPLKTETPTFSQKIQWLTLRTSGSKTLETLRDNAHVLERDVLTIVTLPQLPAVGCDRTESPDEGSRKRNTWCAEMHAALAAIPRHRLCITFEEVVQTPECTLSGEKLEELIFAATALHAFLLVVCDLHSQEQMKFVLRLSALTSGKVVTIAPPPYSLE